ncbi:MAG: phosphoglycerate kinase [Rhodobiaceae bacterium]|nr:phosphoglycerate kinase [Rhodobiaceae bacterium]
MITKFHNIQEKDARNKRIIIRVDLNVPIKNAQIKDNTRIKEIIPTLKELLDFNAAIIIISHMGRPGGEKKLELSLSPIAIELSRLINKDVNFIDHIPDSNSPYSKNSFDLGSIYMLENLRFYPGEAENDKNFIQNLSQIGDIYINDAFSVSHRSHASTIGIANKLPSYAGQNMLKELHMLESLLENPKKPMAAIIGGSKISTKIQILENLIEKVDKIIIGGAMANTFLIAQGHEIGNSLSEPDKIKIAQDILIKAKKYNCKIILPVDAQISKTLDHDVPTKNVSLSEIPKDYMILDLGQESTNIIINELENIKTLIWNGPMGAFEYSPFEKSTITVAHSISKLTKSNKMISVAGGGDTISALNMAGVIKDLTYVSTAGGAFLEWLEGKILPGIKVLLR